MSSDSSTTPSLCPYCDPIPCGNTEQLTLVNRSVYEGDFIITGVGTRNTGNGTITVCGIPDGALVTMAWLYWNVLADNCTGGAEMVSFGVGGLGSCSPSLVIGTCIGYCGNTCWSAQPNDTLTDGADTPQEIFNRIYKADVTSTVMGNGDYCIDGLPYTPEPIAVNGANNAQYPGCAGSQGAALFIIWEWPTGVGPTDSTRLREIAWYDGAVLIAGPSNIPIHGGVSNYSIIHSTTFYGQMNIGFAVGDAQDYPDMAIFNGSPLKGGISPTNFFGPKQGPLLLAQSGFTPFPPKAIFSDGGTTPNVGAFNGGGGSYRGDGGPTNVMQVVSPESECLSWFLWAVSGISCPCKVSTKLVALNGGPGFAIIGNVAKSLGDQLVTVQVVYDPCHCMTSGTGGGSSSSALPPLILSVNGNDYAVDPFGIPVLNGDTLEVKVNTSNCVQCGQTGPKCAGSSSSSSG